MRVGCVATRLRTIYELSELVMTMDEETKRKILEEAYSNLEQPPFPRSPYPRLDELERKKALEELLVYKTHAPPRELDAQRSADHSAAWDEIDRRIADAIAQERRLMSEVIGTSIAEMLHEHRKQDRDLLREEVNRLWQALSTTQELLRAMNHASEHARAVVDLPNPLVRRVN